eukprot:15857266-Heterocapsa_arctica.AAC.1
MALSQPSLASAGRPARMSANCSLQMPRMSPRVAGECAGGLSRCALAVLRAGAGGPLVRTAVLLEAPL